MADLTKTVALVGMMGAGKSSVGRRLATRLGVPFRDADLEIESAAGRPIAEIFDRYGEAAFREGERRVMARLLGEPTHILATGGGAFIDPTTRAAIRGSALSVWIRVPIDVLIERVQRRDDRPLLKTDDPRATLEALLKQREPIYAQADVTVDSEDEPHNHVVARVITALREHEVLA